MRRCLRSFLVALLSLTLLGGPAHACWRTRAKHCRPVQVATVCQPVWDACCDPCGETVVIVESTCPPVDAGCCGGEVAATLEHGVPLSDAVVITDETHHDSVSIIEAAPTPAPESPLVATGEPTSPGLETVTLPPNLEPTGGVEQASNEQPLPEPLPPAEEPTDVSVLAGDPDPAPEMREEEPAEPELPIVTTAEPDLPAAPAGEPDAPATGEPLAPAEEPALPGDGGEPPMKEDSDEAPAADTEEAPVAPVEPPAPAPAPEPEPAPEPGNFFEEVEEESQGSDAESAAMPETSASPFDAPAGEPTLPAGDLFEDAGDESVDSVEPAAPVTDPVPAADPFADGASDAAAAEEEMADDEAAADDTDPADPFAPAEPVPTDESAGEDAPADLTDEGEAAEPADEPAAAANPFAAAEQPRRWIDATGTGSIVGTLVDVPADDRCLLDLGGRQIVVPLAKLSDHDRDYVRRAGVRLAKLRGERQAGETAAAKSPAPTDTAGL